MNGAGTMLFYKRLIPPVIMNPVQQLVGYVIIGNFILKIVFDFQYDSSSVFWFLEGFFLHSSRPTVNFWVSLDCSWPEKTLMSC